MSLTGNRKFVWFKTLNNSPRNWKYTRTIAAMVSSDKISPANLYGGLRAVFSGAVIRYTVRLKFGLTPYSANDANRTTQTIATNEVRIDRPTASPTPTGPPLAKKPK